jgi:hypothetical protein
MKSKMEDYIRVLCQNMPSNLLNNEYADCIRRIGGRLPLLSSGFFEYWFGENQSRVDINIGIDRRLNETETIVACFDNDTAHNTLKALTKPIKKWCGLDLQLWLFTQYFALIYDIPDPRQQSITPWYYITYNPPPLFVNDILSQTAIVLTILKTLEESFSSPLQSEWETFFNNLSPSTRINAVGFQANRQVDALRLALIFNKYTDICSFLEKHQWPGDFEDLRKQTSIVDDCDTYGLTINVNPVLQPKIGIECFYNTPEAAATGYKRLTNRLIELKLCTLAQQKTFLAWEGSFEMKNEPNIFSWPDKYKQTPNLIPTKVNINRAPRHIKIVYEPGSLITAKGYLGYLRPGP